MFDEKNPANKPGIAEDIFAQAEPPSAQLRRELPAMESPDKVTSMPAQADLGGTETYKSHRLLILGAIVVLLLILGGGAWYLWLRTPPVEAPTEPTSQEPATPVETTTITPSQPPASQGDIDGDGLTDTEEQSFGTDPRRADSDEDGLFDREEVQIYKSNPLLFDSDGDGYGDGQEVQNGYSPIGQGRLLELPTGQ